MIAWNEYTANRSGEIDKFVECEKCGTEYVYSLERQVSAEAVSLYFLNNRGAANRAESRADQKLQRVLKSAVEPRPCPECGHFQKDMVRKARSRYLAWMSGNAVAGILAVSLLLGLGLYLVNSCMEPRPLVAATTLYVILGAVGGLILLFPIVRAILAASYDPNNDDDETRIKKGFYPGTPRLEYDLKKVEDEERAKTLPQRAQRLLDRPHPLQDVEEKARHDELLRSYLNGESFAGSELLETEAILCRCQGRDQEENKKAKAYYVECADVFEGIHLELFGS